MMAGPDDLDAQIAKERAAVEALRESVSELEVALQTKRESLKADPPAPAPPRERARAVATPPSFVGAGPQESAFQEFLDEFRQGAPDLGLSDALLALLHEAWLEAFASQENEIKELKKSIMAYKELASKIEDGEVRLTPPLLSPAFGRGCGVPGSNWRAGRYGF